MFSLNDRTHDGTWAVHRIGSLGVAHALKRAAALLGVSRALSSMRRSAQMLEFSVPLCERDAPRPSFESILLRALTQAEAESRNVVRLAALRQSLEARFREYCQTADFKIPEANKIVADARTWVAQCEEQFGPHGGYHARTATLTQAQAALNDTKARRGAIAQRISTANQHLDEFVKKMAESISSMESAPSEPVSVGVLNRRNLRRVSPYVLWLFTSIVLVVLLLPGRSAITQVVVAAGLLAAFSSIQSLVERNDKKEKMLRMTTSVIRESQSAIRRLTPKLKDHFALMEQDFVLSKRESVLQEVINRLDAGCPDSSKSVARLETLQKSIDDWFAKLPMFPFVEITPTRWELTGQRLATQILEIRVSGMGEMEFANRVLRAYEASTGHSLSDHLATPAVSDATIQQTLETVVIGEIGEISLPVVLDAVIAPDQEECLRMHLRILAGAARNVYQFASLLARDQHSGRFTLGLPEGISEKAASVIKHAFPKPPRIELSFGDNVEVWFTAQNLTNSDSALFRRGAELARSVSLKEREALWSFGPPAPASAAPLHEQKLEAFSY